MCIQGVTSSAVRRVSASYIYIYIYIYYFVIGNESSIFEYSICVTIRARYYLIGYYRS